MREVDMVTTEAVQKLIKVIESFDTVIFLS